MTGKIVKIFSTLAIIVVIILGVGFYIIRQGGFEFANKVNASLADQSADIGKFSDSLDENSKDINSLRELVMQQSQTISNLQQQLEETRTKVQEHNVITLAANDVENLRSRFDEIVERQKQLDARMNNSIAGNNEIHFAMLNSLWLLQYRIDFGLPFKTELKNLKRLTAKVDGAEKELVELLPYEDTGIQTIADIVGSFKELEVDIIKKSGTYIPDKNWFEGFMINMASVAQIRKVNDRETGDKVSDIIYRAEKYLARNDIIMAVQELEKLPEEAYSSITSDWIKQAKARVRVDDILGNTYELILSSYERDGSTAH